jgi:hypothetical protein
VFLNHFPDHLPDTVQRGGIIVTGNPFDDAGSDDAVEHSLTVIAIGELLMDFLSNCSKYVGRSGNFVG